MTEMRLLSIILFLVLIGAVVSVEWKKFENGKVESQKRHVARLLKANSTATEETKKVQRILHAHHGDRLARHKGKNNDENDVNKIHEKVQENGSTLEEHKVIKDRHHKKNMEKKFRLLHRGEPMDKPSVSNTDETSKNHDEINTEENSKSFPKSKMKRSKPEEMSSIQWRRQRRMEERSNLEKAKAFAQTWENNRKNHQSKKKMVISKMDGNKSAKKLWKEAFRGENRITT